MLYAMQYYTVIADADILEYGFYLVMSRPPCHPARGCAAKATVLFACGSDHVPSLARSVAVGCSH